MNERIHLTGLTMADEVTATAILHEETLRELGLSEQPFADGKKPHRFTDSTIQKTRASLEQHARFGESVHLLLGDTGAGKTVLLSQLIKHCKNSIKPFVAKGSDGFVAEAFLAAVLNQVSGDESENMTDMVESLAPEFAALNEQQFSVLLTIDDAHLAPVEEIAELISVMSEFNNDGEITARLLLTGEASLKSSLDAIAREYEGMTFEPSVSTVAALTEPQMRDYLSSRLNHAGHTDVFPFTEKALSKIHRESAGLPAAVNTGAAHYLNTVYANAAAGKAGGGLFATLGWPLVALGTAAVGLIAWGLSMFISGEDPDQVVTVKPPTIVANAPVEIKLVEDDADAGTLGTDNTAQSGDDINSAIQDLATTDLQTEQSGDNLLQSAEESVSSVTDNASQLVDNATDAAADTLANAGDQAEESASQAADQLADNLQTAGNAAEETVTNAVDRSTETATESATEAVTETATQTVGENATETAASTAGDQGAAGSTSEPMETIIGTSESGTSPSAVTDGATTAVSQADNGSQSSSRNNGVAITTVQPTVAESEEVDITSLTDSDAASNEGSNGNNSANNNGVAVPLPTISNGDNAGQTEPAAPVITRAVENERWVLFQEPTHFTVQLATSRERNYILELAQGLSESPVAIYPFRTTESQNPVFGLLSGLYETRTEAINAVEKMPKDLKRFGVWIRPISDLQAAIKNNP